MHLFGGGHRRGGGGSHGQHAAAAAAAAARAAAADAEEEGTATAATPAETHGSAFGLCLRQGRRSTMEDFAVARWTRCPRTGDEIGLFAIFDGHGGAHAARFVAEELLDAVLSHELFPTDLPAALVSAFEATDARYLEEGPRRAAAAAAVASTAAAAAEAGEGAAAAAAASAAAAAPSPSSSPRSPPPPPAPPPPARGSGFYYYYGAGGARSPGASCRSPGGGVGGGGHHQHVVTSASAPPGDDGSTAVVAVLRADGTLAIANVGDSRAVLMRGGRAHTLSVDHKPNLREERLRVEKAGGAVIWSGVWRVGVGGGNAGGGVGGGGGLLALSRAFGDRPLKLGAGVVATPDVKVVRLTEQDSVLVLASDGLFDVMNAQEALLIAEQEGCPSAGAARLVAEALARGTMDNVAALVVRLAAGGFGSAGGGGGAGGEAAAAAKTGAAAAAAGVS